MTFIFGLGNPGKQYELNRHNAGFLVIENIAAFFQVSLKKRCLSNYMYSNLSSPFNTILIEPLTFMNRSGECVRHFPIVKEKDIVIVICDNMDLPIGKIRVKKGGGSAGQKGLASMTEYLGFNDFIRIYIGTGRPPEGVAVPDHVLSTPIGKDLDLFREAVQRGAKASEDLINGKKLEDVQLEYNKSIKS